MIVAPPPAALTISPARVQLVGAASAAVQLRNPGLAGAVVDAAPARFALDLAGRPRIVAARDPGVRIVVRPRTLSLQPGGAASIAVAAHIRPDARPGDHPELVLLATRALMRGRVGVRMQVGVVVVVRVPGAVVHRLEVQRVVLVAGRRRALVALTLRNRGNVIESVVPETLRVALVRGRRVLARLHVAGRELLPGSRGIVRVACPRTLHGRMRAIVDLGAPGGRVQRLARLVRLP